MSPKAPSSTLRPPAQPKKPAANSSLAADLEAQWAEARAAYPLYAALATEFGLASLLYPAGKLPPAQLPPDRMERELLWFEAIDEKALAFQIRQLPPDLLNGGEASLRALVRRQLRRPEKTTADRDKIDILLVQYFALCAPDELCRGQVALADVARILRPVLPEADATPLEWCEPLEKILADLAQCESVRDVMEDGLLEQGRLLKDSAGCMFYDPAALVAFCRFNFLLRRTFIRLLHADLNAAREAVGALEAKGVKTADCRRAGFSAAETTTQVRHFCENWRQPFQKDYTESSVRHALEQLLALRADLEEALSRPRPGAGPTGVAAAPEKAASATTKPATTPPAPTAVRTEPKDEKQPVSASGLSQTPAAPAPRAKQAVDAPVSPTGAAEADKCLETIWEQLIAAPPSRGRSMSTVVLQDTKVLLSSWEVAAFVSEGGQDSEDLRRAVVARALLAVGADERKRSGESRALASAVALARTEVSYFQGRVEQSKAAKNTEAAVNLGISTKRLLSFIEEAEKLQP